jgi:hypothetical protein
MTQETSDDLSWRNLLRMRVLEVADQLEASDIGSIEAAERLRELAASDINDMDEVDIEIDFDTGDASLGPVIAAGLSGGSSPRPTGDPVEDALTKVMRLRDRNNGLKIVAETPGIEDLATYQDALCDLRVALNSTSDAVKG